MCCWASHSLSLWAVHSRGLVAARWCVAAPFVLVSSGVPGVSCVLYRGHELDRQPGRAAAAARRVGGCMAAAAPWRTGVHLRLKFKPHAALQEPWAAVGQVGAAVNGGQAGQHARSKG